MNSLTAAFLAVCKWLSKNNDDTRKGRHTEASQFVVAPTSAPLPRPALAPRHTEHSTHPGPTTLWAMRLRGQWVTAGGVARLGQP